MSDAGKRLARYVLEHPQIGVVLGAGMDEQRAEMIRLAKLVLRDTRKHLDLQDDLEGRN